MKYLSIQDAVQKYDTSQTTITRFARQNQKTKNVKKENRKFYILDSFLASHFQIRNSQTIQTSNQSEQKKESSTNEKENSLENGKVINFLQSQNEFLQSQIIEKDKQLNDKSNQIDKLLQRQFEQNSIIQTMQNRFDGMERKIDSSTNLLSEKVTQKNEVGPGRSQTEKGNDNGFTIASAVMIILLVLAIIVFLTVK